MNNTAKNNIKRQTITINKRTPIGKPLEVTVSVTPLTVYVEVEDPPKIKIAIIAMTVITIANFLLFLIFFIKSVYFGIT